MKRWLLTLALALMSAPALAGDATETIGIDGKCYGVDIASHGATALVSSTVTHLSSGTGRWVLKSTDSWKWIDVQNSTNSAAIFISYAIPGFDWTSSSVTLNRVPTISTTPFTAVPTRGWKITAGNDKRFYLPPERVIYARNGSDLHTTGATVCVGK